MRWDVDTAAWLTGYALLTAAAIIAFRPGTRGRQMIEERLASYEVRKVVRRDWNLIVRNQPRLGNLDAKYVVVELVDYRCTYCRMLADTLVEFLKRYPDAAVVLRNAPRPGDRVASFGAIAASCAAKQNEFARMHTHLLRTFRWQDHADWAVLAEEAGLTDAARFSACATSGVVSAELAADSLLWSSLRIRGTPALLTRSNGVHQGIPSLRMLRRWLELNP
jgi:protein-disulfide isomerase